MQTFKQFLLDEGVYDPAKLKAIFLAGGPGSGKSFVQNKIKGDLGFKVVNSDPLFEKGMKKAGLNPKMPDEEKERRDKVRDAAKHSTARQMAHYTDGRLGMIIDGTGQDHEKVRAHAEHLRSLGYDTHMVHVRTSLPVAQERNRRRPRSLPDDTVKELWNNVQRNRDKFKETFGDNYHEIENDNADEDLLHKLHKKVRKIAQGPVQNPEGQKWIEDEKKKRDRLNQ